MEIMKHLLNGSIEQYNDGVVPKIPVFAGEDITSEVYYFKPGQVLKAHRHSQGSTIFVKAGKWHEITNGSSEMVAVQVTKVGAGAEYKEN